MINWVDIYKDQFKNKRVLITGGAGFIGSHLVETLTTLNANVVVIDDLSGGDWNNLSGFDANVTKIEASILDQSAINKATQGCDYVFHEAALGSVPRSVKEPVLYHEVNVMGTINVLEAAREAGVKRVVYAGSSSAYGDPPVDGKKIEHMPPLPRSPYAAAKLAAEHAMRAWSHSYGLDTAVTRYFNIFGPRQNPNSAYAAVIAAFAKALLTNSPATIYGDGLTSRDFTFVHNAVHANLCAAIAQQPLQGEVFNVATGMRTNLNELYAAIAKLTDNTDIQPIYEEERAGDIKHSLADVSKGKNIINYEPLVSFEDGLKQTIDWYRNNI